LFLFAGLNYLRLERWGSPAQCHWRKVSELQRNFSHRVRCRQAPQTLRKGWARVARGFPAKVLIENATGSALDPSFPVRFTRLGSSARLRTLNSYAAFHFAATAAHRLQASSVSGAVRGACPILYSTSVQSKQPPNRRPPYVAT
jgi:hypothetical protein